MYKAGVLMKNKYKHAKKEADAAAAAARATAALPPRVTAADPDNVRGKRTHRAICLDVRERLLMGPEPDSQTAVMASISPPPPPPPLLSSNCMSCENTRTKGTHIAIADV